MVGGVDKVISTFWRGTIFDHLTFLIIQQVLTKQEEFFNFTFYDYPNYTLKMTKESVLWCSLRIPKLGFASPWG